MKIDQNLRAAIRSYCSISPDMSEYAFRCVREDAAVRALLPARLIESDARLRAKVSALRKRVEILGREADAALAPYGVYWADRFAISDYRTFTKAGGKFRVTCASPTDQVIAQLAAAATPAEGAKILAHLGIRWE